MKNLILAIALLWPFGKYILVGHNNSGEIIEIKTNRNPECYLNEIFYMDTKNGKDFFYVKYPTEHFIVFDYYTTKNKKDEKETPLNNRNSDDLANDGLQPD
ncbi:MAG: hypothetical protein H7Y00_13245 [Fimbriimonadaceae bacterium]|nr:hypothetical protein [Chitinophagales bacterium]